MSDAPRWLERLADASLDEVTVTEGGELTLPSGRVAACDPLVFLRGADPFAREVKPGRYPVSIGRLGRDTAFAMLRIKDAKVKRWEVARCPGEEEAEGWPGYGVDSGIGCFVDLDTIEAFVKAEEAGDGPPEEDPLAPIERSLERKVSCSIQLDAAGGGNLVAFRAGAGDGIFASFWGLDARGAPVCLVTDFAVIEPPEEPGLEDEEDLEGDLEDEGEEPDLDDAAFTESDLAGLEALAAALGVREEPEVEQGPSPLFLQARDLLRRWVAEEKIALEEDTNVDVLAEALLEKLVSLAGHRRPGAHVGEWLLDRAEVADVFASDEELDQDLTSRR